jgi:hypothetical protein
MTLKGLSDITDHMEGFFPWAEVGVRTGVFGVVGITGILEIAEGIIWTVEIGGASGVGLEASSSCARHSKTAL